MQRHGFLHKVPLPRLQELVADGVDIVTCSIVEAAGLIDAGKVKSLAIMNSERVDAYPDVPTLKEATGIDWQMAAWRGIAGSQGNARRCDRNTDCRRSRKSGSPQNSRSS